MNFVGKFDAKLPVDGWGAHLQAHTHHVEASAAHVPSDAIIVPDAHLLFEGDYKRTGVDLVISNDERELVLHDYFKGEKRAALSSPDGAHLTGDIVNALTGHVEYAQAAGNPGAGQVIGHVTKLQGTATAIRNGVSIILNQGDNVEKGDVIQSGSASTVGVTFIDGSVFGLSSNARMVLNEMVYDPNGSSNSSLISLVAGTISFVAGETAKHGDMKVDTPVATMGIRGTAVLVEIDFDIPGQNGSPSASFQVLVEPDGTTGSYILFDKTTLAPIATVNQAGQLLSIHDNMVSISSTGLTPEVQKLITDVFSQKFTDNTNQNTKTTTAQTDTIVPIPFAPIKLASGATATPIVLLVNTSANAPASSPTGSNSVTHIDGAPDFVATSAVFGELPGVTGSHTHDIATGTIRFVDVNSGDKPTAAATFQTFTYQDAHHNNITTLSDAEIAAIHAVEIPLSLVADAGNNNNGLVTWTYNLADGAFDFLGAGETLTLTYQIAVNNNYAPNPETRTQLITITITGTNDVPVITSSVPTTITFSGGTSTPGGDLTTNVPTSGSIVFDDADLTDTHTVSVVLGSVVLGEGTLPPAPLQIFEHALTVWIATDSTGTGIGTINWNLADLPVYLADFIPRGETLDLTYVITVTDSQGATATQDITVTITGTDTPAVVWIATTATGSPPGGLWSDASNWETGTVPTATDDVIIITNQLIGLTPSYPVTINAPAVAGSVAMNDFGTSPPQLINESTLTVGGQFSMNADSIVDNAGTISVGGLLEVLDNSVLQNSGTITLKAGGDFKGKATISNTSTGLIEVSGGTLNVQVNIANAGQLTIDSGATVALGALTLGQLTTITNTGATITVDGGGMLTLSDASITGGTINDYSLVSSSIVAGNIDVTGSSTISGASLNNGDVTIESNQTLTLDNDTVTGTSFADTAGGAVIRIDGGTTLTLDGVTINGGAITDNGTVNVDATKTLKLNGVALSGGTITNAGTIEIAGSSSIENDTLGNAQLTVDSGQTLTLDGTTVTGGTITNTGATLKVDAGTTLTLQGGIAVVGGTLSDSGTVKIEGTSAVTLDGVTVTGSGAIQVDTPSSPASTLVLDDGTAITGGTLTMGPAGALAVKTAGGARLNDVDVTNGFSIEVFAGSVLILDQLTSVANAGAIMTIDGTGTLTLNDASITGGTINNYSIVSGSIVAGDIDVTGSSTISGASLNNGDVTIGSSATLTLDNVTVTDALFADTADGAVIQVDGATTLTLDGVTVDGGAITDNGTVNVDATKTLKLNGVALSGGAITNAGTIEITGSSSIENDTLGNTQLTVDSGQTLTLDGSTVTGGTITNTGATLKVDADTTLTLQGGVTVVGGTLDDSGTVKIEGTSGATLDGVTVTGSGAIQVDGAASPASTLILEDGTVITGGTLTMGPAGTLAIETAGGATLSDVDVTNGYSIEVFAGSVLILDQLTSVANAGAIMTIDGTGKLTLNDASITGGTINNYSSVTSGSIVAGDIDITGSSSISDASLNNGQVTIESNQTLTLDGDTVIGTTFTDTADGAVIQIDSDTTLDGVTVDGGGITDSGIVNVDATKTLKLNGVALSGGSITNAGSIEIVTSSSIENDTFGNAQLTVDGGQTLTLDGTTITGGTVTNTGATLKVDTDTTLTLQGGVTVVGGTLDDAGTVQIEGASGATLDGVNVTGAGAIQVDGAKSPASTLVLEDGTVITGGTLTMGPAGTLAVETAGGAALHDVDITNGYSIEVFAGSVLILDQLTSVANAGATMTIDGTGTLTLNNASITGGTINNYSSLTSGSIVAGDIDITGSSSIIGASLNNGQVTIESNQTLTLDNDTVTGTSFADTADGAVIQIDGGTTLKLDGVSITGGTINDYSLVSGSIVAGDIDVTGSSKISGASLNHGDVTIGSGATLTLDNDTVTGTTFADTADGAIIQIDGGTTLTLDGVSITGGTINNYSSVTSGSIVAGDIDIIGSSTITSASLNNGQVTIESNQTLTLNGDTVTGTTFIDTADGVVIQIDNDTTMDGVTVDGGVITDSGTVNVDASKTLKLNGVALSGGSITNAGTIEIVTSSSIENDTFGNAQLTVDGGQTLTLDGTTITGGTVTNTGATLKVDTTLTLQGGVAVVGGTLDDSGTVKIEGTSGATLDGVTVTGSGAIQVDGAASPASTLILEDGTVITGGTLTMGPAGTLAVETAGGATLHDVDITNGHSIEVFAGSGLTLDQLTTVTNTGATITIDGTGTLTLNDVSITGGAINNYSSVTSGSIVAGDIDITGSSSISGASLNNGQVTIESNQTLTLDNDTVTGTSFADTADGAIIQIDGGTTLKLSGASITGGTINNYSSVTSGSIVAADIDVTGSSKISGASLNHGDVTIGSGATLTLDNDTVTGTAFTDTADGAAIQIDGGTTLTLDGVSITGGTINNYSLASGSVVAGDIDITVSSTITSASLNNGQVTIGSNQTLTLDNDMVTGTSFADTADGAIIQIDGGTTLKLSGASITGGTINNYSSVTSGSIVAGDIDITGSSSISDASLNNGQVTIESNQILTLDGDTVIGTAFTDTASGAVIQIDSDTTMDGVTISGGAITDNGTVNVDATKTLKLNGVVLSGGAITNAGIIEITGSSGIENDTLGNAQLTVDSGQMLTLDGTTITGGTVTNTGATLKVDTNTTLTLQGGVTVVGGTLSDSGTVKIEGTSAVTLDGVTVTGSGTIQVDGAASPASTLVLEDGTVITGGTLTMGPAGTLAVETAGGATLHDVDVTNGHSIEVFAGSVLILDQLTSVANADAIMTIDGTGTLELNDASITGGTINDYSSVPSGSIVAGDIDITGSSSIDGASLNYGDVTIESGQTLTLDNDTVTGTTFNDTASGASIRIDLHTTLTLDDVTITGGTINDYNVATGRVIAADIDITGSSTISDASLNHGHVVIGAGQTLTLDDDIVTGTWFIDTASDGTIQIDQGTTLTLDGVRIYGGTINDYSLVSGSIIAGDIEVSGSSLFVNADINYGTVTIDAGQTLTLFSGTITGTSFDDSASGAILQVDAVTGLILNGATITGGTINDHGPNQFGVDAASYIYVDGSSTFRDVSLNDGNVTTQNHSTLTLDDVTVTGTVFDTLNGSAIQIDGGTTLKLDGVSITGGTINDFSTAASGSIIAGDIDITGSSTITNASLNHGDVTIENGQTLKLDQVTVNDTTITFAGSGTLEIDQPSTFSGKIAGISGSSDVLDLGGFDAAHDTVVASTGSGSYDSATNTTSLLVTDETTHQSTTLTLVGDYSGSSWTATSDGHGGADIVDPPAAPPATVATGSSFEVASAASAEDVTFHSSTGSLILDNPSGFTGVISGFTGDGTLAGSDQIDLKGIDYHSSSFTESYDAADDTLSVSDGVQDATLHLTGIYQAANFSFTTDGHGGTIVYDPPVPSSAGSGNGAQPSAATTNGQSFVFNFASLASSDAHLNDSASLTKAASTLNKINDEHSGSVFVTPDGHDAFTAQGIVKAQLHAGDFHFV